MKSKSLLVFAIFVAAGAILALATQPWITVRLVEGAAAQSTLAITGQEVNASLSPVVLAALAGALALTIAGRVFRVILGAVLVLLGIAAVWIAVYVYVDTAANYTLRVAEVTGLSGTGSSDLVLSVAVSPLVATTAALAMVLALAGGAVLVFGGKWKSAGRRYSARTEDGAGAQPGTDRFDDWDSLSDGRDPSESGDPDESTR